MRSPIPRIEALMTARQTFNLFLSPERADREHKPPVFTRTVKPSFGRQFTRLQPSFSVLRTAFEQKALKIQQSPTGINPEFALVFEIIGTVDNFYTAVKHTEGLEWIFDSETDPFEPDDDFYQVDKDSGERVDDSLNGKLYCIMSNQQAISQLLSLWQRHKNGETDLRPKQSGFDKITEGVPDDSMFIDVLHRAVKRMMEGDGQESATAPNTKVINLSIGDPVRQLAGTMSPTARLLDFLSYKYKILFIISAGNHPGIETL